MTLRRSLLPCFLLACALVTIRAVEPPPDATGSPPDIAAILKRGELVIAMVSRDEPPYFTTNAAGEPVGNEVDLARMIAKQLGVKPVFNRTAGTYDGVVDEVADHRADIGIGMLSVTSRRALKVSFTEPYFKFHPSLLVNRFLMAQYGWQKDVLANMAKAGPSVKIGVLSGSSGIDEIREDFPGTTVVEYNSWDNILQDIGSGAIFAAVSSAPTVQSWVEQHPEITLQAVEVVNTRHIEAIGIAVPWNTPNFRYWLTLYIRELQDDGLFSTGLSNPATK